jgi:hypothetical protein
VNLSGRVVVSGPIGTTWAVAVADIIVSHVRYPSLRPTRDTSRAIENLLLKTAAPSVARYHVVYANDFSQLERGINSCTYQSKIERFSGVDEAHEMRIR